MTSVVFKNKGVIDVRAITTFGVSSKENPTAIGFFGTGLKYAISILLREGCEIEIFAGKSRHLKFATRKRKIRVDEFNFVTMNNRQLGFTTEVGKTWAVWMALRELYCNCIDENGEVYETEAEPQAEAGNTLVIVRGEKFLDAWATRDNIFLSSEPIERHPAVNIHPGKSDHVFYRGVRAYKLTYSSEFTYDIRNKVDLTEDRTVKYYWDVAYAIRQGLCKSDIPQVVQKAVTAPKDSYEHGFDFAGVEPSKTFLHEVTELTRKFDSTLSSSARVAAQAWVMEQLHEDVVATQLNAVDQLRLERAIAFCRKIGFDVDEYPIIVTEFLGEEVLGRAHDGRIYISKRALMMGTKMLAGTLMEEFIHIRHSLDDETRTMQNFLIDTIMSLGERVTGEPL